MKWKVCILVLISFSIFSCKQKPSLDNNSILTGKSFLLENVEIIDGLNYHYVEFLENNKYIYEFSTDSTPVLQTGYWDCYKLNDEFFLVIEEIERLDTFPINISSKYHMEFLNKLGDTLKFKLNSRKSTFENSLLLDNAWFCLNDSVAISFDTVRNDFSYKHSEFYFNENGNYWFLNRDTLKGNWNYNSTKEIIVLDSLKQDRELLKIEKLTIDTLFFWKRNNRNDMKMYKYIKRNSV